MIIVVTKNHNLKTNEQDDLLIINEKVRILDTFHLLINDKVYEFQYLIFDDLSLIIDATKLDILIDDEPVTNCYGETSNDYVYYGDIISCLNYLRNGD